MTRLALLSFCLAATSVLSLVSSTNLFAQEQLTDTQSVASPDGSIEVDFALRDGVPTYSRLALRPELIRQSRLGFLLEDAPSLDGNFRLGRPSTAHSPKHGSNRGARSAKSTTSTTSCGSSCGSRTTSPASW